MFPKHKVDIEERNIPSLIRSGNDREVIQWFYQTIFPKVKAYIVSRRGEEQDAYDVFQDGLLYLYNKIMRRELDEEKYLTGGLLFRLSINRWLNKLKKDSRNISVEDYDYELEAEFSNDQETVHSVKKGEEILRNVFNNLEEKCIELLHFTIYYDMLMEDIAERLGFSSVGAAKMQLKRCKEKLYKEIEQNPGLKDRLINELS